MRPNTQSYFYPWSAWLLAALFYFLFYGLLVFPEIIAPELYKDLKIDPEQIGFVSSAILYTYVVMQIPVGILFDKYSCRLLLTLAALCVAVGALLFSMASTFWFAALSRMLMGVGGSFAFVGAVYVGKSWFSFAMFPIIVGITEAMSGVGEMILPNIFAKLQTIQHWRVLVFEWSVLIFILAIALFMRVREKNEFKHHEHLGVKQELKVLFSNHRLWLLGIYTGLTYVHFIVMVGMWNVSVLEKYYRISITEAVFVNTFPVLGFTVGCFSMGYVTQYFAEKRILLTCSLLQIILLAIVIYVHISLPLAAILLMILGFVTAAVVLTFDVAKRCVSASSYGLAAGFINMFFGGIGMILIPIVGYLLQVTGKNIYIAAIPIMIVSLLGVLVAISFNVSRAPYLQKNKPS